MEKYKFIKPYSTKITVGGAVGITTKSFKVGDIVEGEEGEKAITARIAPSSAINDGKPSNMTYQEFINIPLDNLEKVNVTANLFTQKNILIGIVVLVSIFAVLKYTKKI